MDEEVFVIALVLTLIVSAIASASFWQGVGIFVFMYFVAAAYCNEVRKK
jgi:hypothetical protein